MFKILKRVIFSIGIGRAYRKLATSDYDGAFSILKEFIDESDVSWSANFLAGVCLAERGNIDGASEYFEKAIILVSRNKRYSKHDLYHILHYLYSRYDYAFDDGIITDGLIHFNYDNNKVSGRMIRYMPMQ